MLSPHGPLTRYVILRVAHAPGMPGTISPPPWVSDPDMHHGTCVTHMPWCMPGSLTSGFLWNRWQRKLSRHSWRLHNPQLCVSDKRHMENLFKMKSYFFRASDRCCHLLRSVWKVLYHGVLCRHGPVHTGTLSNKSPVKAILCMQISRYDFYK